MEITCGIFLQRKDGKVLFIHPTLSPDRFISIPKGIYEDTDGTYFNAAKRELMEETGINLDDYSGEIEEIEGIFQYKTRNKALKAFIFRSEQQIEQKLACTSYFYHEGKNYIEADEFYWLDPHEIHIYSSSCPFSPHQTQQKIIDQYFPPNTRVDK